MLSKSTSVEMWQLNTCSVIILLEVFFKSLFFQIIYVDPLEMIRYTNGANSKLKPYTKKVTTRLNIFI